MLRNLISILLLPVFCSNTISQTTYKKYQVTFTDKNNTPYSIDHPEDFLSIKAIERRTKFNIPIIEEDLPINPSYLDSLRKYKATIINRSKWFNSVTVYFENDSIIDSLNFVTFIKGIVYTGFYNLKMKTYKPNALLNITYQCQTDIQNKKSSYNNDDTKKQFSRVVYDYGEATNQIKMLNGDLLHKKGYIGSGKIIAVLDGGFYDVNNLPIFNNLWLGNQILGVKDFIDPLSDVYKQSNHGMKVLSVMSANSPGVMIGTAPGAMYLLLRTEDAPTEYITEEDSWASGAEFADSCGADIINSSLGYTTFDDPLMNHIYADMDGNTTRVTKAAEIAFSKGMIVVNSAGNSGIEEWKYIGAPADGNNVLAIGAVDKNGDYATFSSTGPTADNRIKPDLVAQGYLTTLASTIEGVTSGNGTSYSAPIISGLLACLWQASPDLSNQQLINIVKSSCSGYDSPDNLIGYGIPDFAKAFIEATEYYIPNFDDEGIVQISPNPFIEYLEVSFLSNVTNSIDIEIIDISGRVVYSNNKVLKLKGYNNIQIDSINFLAQGVYILKIKSRNNIYSQKIIKGK